MSYLKVNSIQSEKSDPLIIQLRINNKNVKMAIDTGSEISVISKQDFERQFGEKKLNQLDSTKTVLRTFSGEKIKPLGIAKVKVEYQGQKKHLNLFVVEKGMSTLFGRSWLEKLQLNWKELRNVMNVGQAAPQKDDPLPSKPNKKNKAVIEYLLARYESVFEDGIGKVEGMKANRTFKEEPKPVFCKARTIPFAKRPKVEEELDNLEEMGIISKVNTSEWVTPVVPCGQEK